MPQHSSIQSAECHEPKGITNTLTTDAGKVITPSSVVAGQSVIRKLTIAELSDGAAVTQLTTAQTLTNKRITPRVVTSADAAPVAINSDTTDQANINLVTLSRTIANPTGTPVDGQRLFLRVKQGAAGALTITFDTAYNFPAGTPPVLTVTANKYDYYGFAYNFATNKWDRISIAQNL